MSRRWTGTEISIATSRGHVRVRARVTSAAPGLALHRPLKCSLFDGKTITHVASGRVIVNGVPSEYAPQVLLTLARLGDWTRSEQDILDDETLHQRVRTELLKPWYTLAAAKVLQ